MHKLKYTLLVVGPVGAALTMPTIEALGHLYGLFFLVLFFGFCVLTWAGLMLGKPIRSRVNPIMSANQGSTRGAPLSVRE